MFAIMWKISYANNNIYNNKPFNLESKEAETIELAICSWKPKISTDKRQT